MLRKSYNTAGSHHHNSLVVIWDRAHELADAVVVEPVEDLLCVDELDRGEAPGLVPDHHAAQLAPTLPPHHHHHAALTLGDQGLQSVSPNRIITLNNAT